MPLGPGVRYRWKTYSSGKGKTGFSRNKVIEVKPKAEPPKWLPEPSERPSLKSIEHRCAVQASHPGLQAQSSDQSLGTFYLFSILSEVLLVGNRSQAHLRTHVHPERPIEAHQ